MRRREIMYRANATAKREGHYFGEWSHKSGDCPYRSESAPEPNQNKPKHGRFICRVWYNVNSVLFAGVTTLEEPNLGKCEPVGSDPDEPEYTLKGSESERVRVE